ncbi:MAG: DUF5990 family protein [Fimbriimonas sp.]
MILEITVTDVTIMCDGLERLELLVQTKDGHERGRWNDDQSMTFEVSFELRADRLGNIQPWGEAVQRQPDGRRFVYLTWCRTKDGHKSMPGRMKIFFDQVPGFPADRDRFRVRVKGRDAKGRLACASVKLEPFE